MNPISRAALTWLCRELAPGGRVVRVRPMRGGVSCCVHAVWLETAGGTRFSVVVRRYGEDWNDDRGVCGREFKVLEALAASDVPVARPLLLDELGAVFGAPTLVMTRLDGRATLQPRKLQGYLDQLAGALARLHQQPIERFSFLPSQRTREDRIITRGRASDDPLEVRVWDVVHAMWPTIAYEQRVVHGDFWPGNTVWCRDRLSGVIDWETAARGSASRDVATCRLDLTNLFDLETAGTFTSCYETAVGAQVANLPFWDLLVATGALRYIENWARGYRDLGRTDLSGELARARAEQFARAALLNAQD